MFKVLLINVAAPLVPVVVSVIVFCLLLNVLQSVELKYPLIVEVAAGIEIVFKVLTNGDEKVNTFSLPLKVIQSAELNAPLIVAVAVGRLKV